MEPEVERTQDNGTHLDATSDGTRELGMLYMICLRDNLMTEHRC